jgi:phosphate transport system substrate-binding protein
VLGNVSKKAVTFGLIATMVTGVMTGCGTKTEEKKTTEQTKTGETAPAKDELSGKITSAGSTALLPLVKQAANEFQKKHPNVTVEVSGGGSGTGLKQVAEGTIDIGNSDNPAGDEYKDKNLKDHVVAIAPFLLVTHKDVKVDNLTQEQAAKILSGEITNWKDVGGQDQKITIIGRAEGSGTRKYIKSAILGKDKDFAKDAIAQDSSGAVRTAVEQTAGAIGYLDAAYVSDKVKALKYDGVAYSPENVKNKTYKLFSEEHMYTKGEPNKLAKAFLDYILSDEFQNKYVEELKFMPVSKMK